MTKSPLRLAPSACFLLLSALVAGCSIYDRNLLANGAEGTGGAETGGASSGGMMSASGGGGGEVPMTGGTDSGGSEGTGGSQAECTWDKDTALLTTEPTELVDDFDDGDSQIPEVGGRDGQWFSLNDGSGGFQSPGISGWNGLIMKPVNEDEENRALHYIGADFTGTGKGDGWHLFGTQLAAGTPYDLSAFDGISFWVRTDCEIPAAEQAALRVAISDSQSEGSAGAVDHSGTSIDMELSTEWKQLKLPFDNFTRRFGSSAIFEQEGGITIYFSPSTEGTLDIWIDDLVLYSDE